MTNLSAYAAFSVIQPNCMICSSLSARNSLNVHGVFSCVMDDSGGDKLKASTSSYWNPCSTLKSFVKHTTP